MARQIGCKHCRGVFQKQFGKKFKISRERTWITPPTMFAPKTCNCKSQREDVSIQERGQHSNVQPRDDKQFDLKCPNWRLWAYTARSCIGETKNYIDAGVYWPQTKAECYVNSGGVGLTDTIHRAELTGFAAALTIKYTKIATESPSARLEKFFPLECNEPIYTQIC